MHGHNVIRNVTDEASRLEVWCHDQLGDLTTVGRASALVGP